MLARLIQKYNMKSPDHHTLNHIYYEEPKIKGPEVNADDYVSLQHKTSHKGQFLEIEMYALSES